MRPPAAPRVPARLAAALAGLALLTGCGAAAEATSASAPMRTTSGPAGTPTSGASPAAVAAFGSTGTTTPRASSAPQATKKAPAATQPTPKGAVPGSLGSLKLKPLPNGRENSGQVWATTISARGSEAVGPGSEVGLWLPDGMDRVRGLYFSAYMEEQSLLQKKFRAYGKEQVMQANRMHFGVLFMRVQHRAGTNNLSEYECDRTWSAIQRGLTALAKQAGHPEAASAPLVVEGGSRGTKCPDGMLKIVSKRIIALDYSTYGVPNCSRPGVADIPTVVREGETTAGDIYRAMIPCRRKGMAIAVAVQATRNGHNSKQTSWIQDDFIDSVTLQRVPADPRKPLLRLDLTRGLLADNLKGTVTPWASATARETRSWLPNACTAAAWKIYRKQPPNGSVYVPRSPDCPPR